MNLFFIEILLILCVIKIDNEDKIEFIEIYFKGDKEDEDRYRLKNIQKKR